ncbi:hypothetical protein D3C78_1755680 [compost metagenome]
MLSASSMGTPMRSSWSTSATSSLIGLAKSSQTVSRVCMMVWPLLAPLAITPRASVNWSTNSCKRRENFQSM